jgi:predicted RNA-binding Zn-ribbon protein involved in translation (DUF1610 family)
VTARTSFLTPEQAELANELGWEGSAAEELEWLQCLLDDEFEQLQPADRGRLRARLADHQAAHVCPDCGNVSLGRYRPDDARCRVCAAPLEDPTRSPAVGIPLDPAVSAVAEDTPWRSADALCVGHSVVLDAENEDWDDRTERIEREQAEADRLRRQAELAQHQAEERRQERERKRQQLTELIPPVSSDRLSELKKVAHKQIEERLQQNRRRRRLLRGGRLKGR